jgi:SAM-dependent methyltransferase
MTNLAMLPRSDQVAACLDEGRRVTVLRDSWDAHANEWIAWVRAAEQPDSYFRFHREDFLSLVPAPGALTLDIGCGEGRVGRDLEKLGHKVLGVDWSFTMCKAAATHPSAPAHVAVGDAAKLPLSSSSIDCVTAFMCLQDIDDMPGTIDEIARVLKDGGKLALAIVHPMYSGGKFSKTETSDEDFVIKRSYFEPEICISEGGQEGMKVTFIREHRPLERYIQTLLDAGFTIQRLHEVTDKDESRPWHRVPMFLDILACKSRKEIIRPSHRHRVIRHAAASLPRCSVYTRKQIRHVAASLPRCSRYARRRIILWAGSTRVLSGLGIVTAATAWFVLNHLR